MLLWGKSSVRGGAQACEVGVHPVSCLQPKAACGIWAHFFFFSTVEELERPEKTETDFVNAVKLRKIQGREKDGPGDTFPSMNSACPESPGSEV